MDLGFAVGSPSSALLRQLSDEVNRIAGVLARLAVLPTAEEGAVTTRLPEVKVETVRRAIESRRLRAKHFDSDLFADPAWDMLLDLFQAELTQVRVPISSLCIAAAVPQTTALRWINVMTEAGLFARSPDPNDGRRMFVELTLLASNAMRKYFGEISDGRATTT